MCDNTFHLIKISSYVGQGTTKDWKAPTDQNQNLYLLPCDKQAEPEWSGNEDVPVYCEKQCGNHCVQVGKC